MAESDLYIPVRDWLRAQGWTVHVELFDCDVIATKPDTTCPNGVRIRVVELKPCLTGVLMCQLYTRAMWADEVMAAVASEARATTELRDNGFGLLQVRDGKVRQRISPKLQPWQWHKRRAYRLKKLAGRAPAQDHELAGLPSCPRLREQRELREVHCGH